MVYPSVRGLASLSFTERLKKFKHLQDTASEVNDRVSVTRRPHRWQSRDSGQSLVVRPLDSEMDKKEGHRISPVCGDSLEVDRCLLSVQACLCTTLFGGEREMR